MSRVGQRHVSDKIRLVRLSLVRKVHDEFRTRFSAVPKQKQFSTHNEGATLKKKNKKCSDTAESVMFLAPA